MKLMFVREIKRENKTGEVLADITQHETEVNKGEVGQN